MSYPMDSAWQISCWITPSCRNRIGPKSEELAAPGPMEGSGAGRVCTLGMLLLVQRSSSQRSAAGGRVFAVSSSSRCPFFFQTLNSGPQPGSNRFFGLLLVAVPVEGIQSLPRCVERNVAAGNLSERRSGGTSCIRTQSPHGPGFSLES